MSPVPIGGAWVSVAPTAACVTSAGMISPQAAIATMTRTDGAELSRTPVGDETADRATPVASLPRHRRQATFIGPPRLSA